MVGGVDYCDTGGGGMMRNDFVFTDEEVRLLQEICYDHLAVLREWWGNDSKIKHQKDVAISLLKKLNAK